MIFEPIIKSYRKPYSFHLSLTNAAVPSSAVASCCISLVYPSSFHLVVASIPIFDPKFGKEDAGSKVSVGALSMIMVSRLGSVLVVMAHNTSSILWMLISEIG